MNKSVIATCMLLLSATLAGPSSADGDTIQDVIDAIAHIETCDDLKIEKSVAPELADLPCGLGNIPDLPTIPGVEAVDAIGAVEDFRGLTFACVDASCETEMIEDMYWCSGWGQYILKVVSVKGKIKVTFTCRGNLVAECTAIEDTCTDQGEGYTGKAHVSITRDNWAEGSYSIEDPINPEPVCYDVVNPSANNIPCEKLNIYGN